MRISLLPSHNIFGDLSSFSSVNTITSFASQSDQSVLKASSSFLDHSDFDSLVLSALDQTRNNLGHNGCSFQLTYEPDPADSLYVITNEFALDSSDRIPVYIGVSDSFKSGLFSGPFPNDLQDLIYYNYNQAPPFPNEPLYNLRFLHQWNNEYKLENWASSLLSGKLRNDIEKSKKDEEIDSIMRKTYYDPTTYLMKFQCKSGEIRSKLPALSVTNVSNNLCTNESFTKEMCLMSVAVPEKCQCSRMSKSNDVEDSAKKKMALLFPMINSAWIGQGFTECSKLLVFNNEEHWASQKHLKPNPYVVAVVSKPLKPVLDDKNRPIDSRERVFLTGLNAPVRESYPNEQQLPIYLKNAIGSDMCYSQLLNSAENLSVFSAKEQEPQGKLDFAVLSNPVKFREALEAKVNVKPACTSSLDVRIFGCHQNWVLQVATIENALSLICAQANFKRRYCFTNPEADFECSCQSSFNHPVQST